MRILAVVCSNGLGHYRRTVGVLRRVVDYISDLEVSIACSQWQVERLSKELAPFQKWHEAVNYIDNVTVPGVRWSSDPAVYMDGSLLAWEDRLVNLDLHRYDTVISDNLTGVLAYRSDALLMGSFLWSDVLDFAYPDHSEVKAFVERERRLLAKHHPRMICVEAFATPGVLSQTEVVGCQPMCEGAEEEVLPFPSEKPVRVGVLGGATDAARGVLDSLVKQLVEETDYQLALPEDVLVRLGFFDSRRIVSFQFTPMDYQQCHVIIGRPGIGTLQDALAAGRPLLCVCEAGQLEMFHLGRRVEELGIGLDFTDSRRVDLSEICRGVETLLSESSRAKLAITRRKIGVHGLDQAAGWLTNFLSGENFEMGDKKVIKSGKATVGSD